MANKHTKLYDKSPKAERDEDGNMKVKKAEADENKESGAGEGEDGSQADMANAPMKEMHDRHVKEHSDMGKRHVEEHKQMLKRHAKEMKKAHGDESEEKEEE